MLEHGTTERVAYPPLEIKQREVASVHLLGHRRRNLTMRLGSFICSDALQGPVASLDKSRRAVALL